MATQCQAIGCSNEPANAIVETKFGHVEMCYDCQPDHVNGR